MLLGPVFQTEMVTSARRARYFVLRVLFAAGLLLCLWSCYEGVTNWQVQDGRLSIQDAAQLAGAFFQAFAWLTLITAMVVTPAVAAGAIASERERRTIEYLFATDLSNAEIVLSKLFSKLLLVGKLVIVALPVLAIFRLLGGIPGNLLIVYFVGLASTIILLTMGSMCISVWTPRARDAIIRVYLVEAVIFVLPLILWMPLMAVGGATGRWSWIAEWLSHAVSACMAINPLVVLGRAAIGGAGTLGVGLDESIIWRMVYLHAAITVALAALAVAAVRRVHLRSVSSPGSATRRRRWELPRFRPPLADRPMLWKELFALGAATKLGVLGRFASALVVIVTVGTAIFSYYMLITTFTPGWQSKGEQYLTVTMAISGVLGVGVVLLMGLRAAGLVTYEKERDCWLSLMSTPLTGAEIIGAKAVGNFYAFRWMLLPLVVVWLLQVTLSPVYLVAIPLNLLAIGATGLFATAVGLAYSLRLSTSLKSIGATMGTLFFIGGGYLLCCCIPMAIASNDDDVFKIAMVGCIPFLQGVSSAIVVVDDLVMDEPWMLLDYVAGVGGYGTIAVVILATLIARFESFVGRTSSLEYYQQGAADPLHPLQPPNLPTA